MGVITMTGRQIVVRDSVTIITPRQIDVLREASRGRGLLATAAVLGISEQTVKTYRAQVVERMKMPNITAACVAAVRLGLI